MTHPQEHIYMTSSACAGITYTRDATRETFEGTFVLMLNVTGEVGLK